MPAKQILIMPSAAVYRVPGEAALILCFSPSLESLVRPANGHPALVKGDIEFLDSPGGTAVFTRREGNERILCAFNLGHSAAALTLDASSGLQALAGHGFGGGAKVGPLRLQGYDAWFGRMAS